MESSPKPQEDKAPSAHPPTVPPDGQEVVAGLAEDTTKRDTGFGKGVSSMGADELINQVKQLSDNVE